MTSTITGDSVVVPRRASRREPLGGAYFWLILFMVVYCARPEDWVPGLATIPLAKITGVLAVIALVLALGQVRQRLPRESIYLILLGAQLCLTVPFAIWRGGAFQQVLEFLKVVVIVTVMVLVVRTAKRLRWLLFVQASSVATVAVVSVWKGRLLRGRLEGVLNGNYSNSNDLAISIVLGLPLCLVFLFRSRSKLRKAAWGAAMLVMMYGVFRTSSRTGLIALCVAAVVCLWEFAIRGRRRYLLVVVAIAGIAFWIYAGRGVRGRMDATLHDTSRPSGESAYQSAQARWDLLVKSLKVTASHPLFGIGPGNFPIVSGMWRVTHNSYTQMSAEAGIPALILYVLILWRGFDNLRAVKKLARGPGEARLLAGALHASLAAFLVASFFASYAYQFGTFFLVGYTTVLYRITLQETIATRNQQDTSREQGVQNDPEQISSEREAAWSAY